MAKVLKMEDIKKAIVDYVNDDRKHRPFCWMECGGVERHSL